MTEVTADPSQPTAGLGCEDAIDRPAADASDDVAADTAAYVDELATLAAGLSPGRLAADNVPPPPSIEAARHHLDEAWQHAAAGTEVPVEARMRQAKRAVLLAMRPVTSHQVQFNQELSIAVKELAVALDVLAGRTDWATDQLEDATRRVHAALATVEVTVDDLLGQFERLDDQVVELSRRTLRLEDELAAERAEARSLRARQDVVLRNAMSAIGGKSEKRRLSELAGELDDSAELLSEDLAELVRGSRAEVRAELEELVPHVAPLSGSPILDLGSGRGEWLELLREHGIDATGIDPRKRAVHAASDRDLEVSRGEVLGHLAQLAESSIGAITAFHLVDHLAPDALLELLDRSLMALRPGGLLIVTAANPTALDVGAAEIWIDPALRRPMHPQLLELLALSRGFGEAETCWLRPADEASRLHPDDLTGMAPRRAEAVAARLNQVLAGPRSFAVLARKAGAAPPSGT